MRAVRYRDCGLCGHVHPAGPPKGGAAMRSTAPISFDRGRDQVEGMMGQGTAFGRVEDAIDAAELSDEHKAALWLLAWSLRDPWVQRRDARLILAVIVSGAGAGPILRGR